MMKCRCTDNVDLLLTGKYKDSVGQKAASLECTELIYVKTMETACVSNELCRFKEKEEGERQIVSLGDSHIKRLLDRLATLSIPTVRVEALEYS